MTIVILQPSYVPWRGYFDLIRAADIFVFYDDVQYDKHGWRNRNRIRTSAGTEWLTIPIRSKSNIAKRLQIRDAEIHWEKEWNRSHRERITASYLRAPFFEQFWPRLAGLLAPKHALLVDYTIPLTIEIAAALGITKTQFVRSSELAIESDDPTTRLVDIVRHLGGNRYISGPSAAAYLKQDEFLAAGIELSFIEYSYPEYNQIASPFDPQVSVLDLLFMQGERASDYIWGSAMMANRQTS